MKIIYYFVFVLFFVSCSGTDESESSSGITNEGTVSSPVELTVGTAHDGTVSIRGYSYYKFTTSSGAGSYKINIGSLVVKNSFNGSNSVFTTLYSNSGYTSSSSIKSEECLTDCNLNLGYTNLDNSTYYYLKIYGYGRVSYSLTLSKGGSEGSKNNPVELTLSTAHTGGTVEGLESNYFYHSYNKGNSYYKFTTTSADNYTLSMNNSDSLDCYLYSNSAFSSLVSNTYNGCTAGTNLSAIFKGSGTGLSESTAYYLMIQKNDSTVEATTYDNMTVAPEG